MQSAPHETYVDLMSSIRDRFDVITKLAKATGSDFGRAEAAAFHGRKIVEGIAFGCLVATERGLKHVPKDAKGQWNAETILTGLKKKGLKTFPSPSLIRRATSDEQGEHGVGTTVEGIPERRISPSDLIAMYQRMHRWLHELNPYVAKDRAIFYASNGQSLWADLAAIERFIEKHFISIAGEGFFCVLRDSTDGMTKVLPLSKAS